MFADSVRARRSGALCAVILAAACLHTAGRALAETVIPSAEWKNTITFPSDTFRAQGSASDDPGWIKFTIFVSDPSRVYFQDSRTNHYPFHYPWARDHVVEYGGMTSEQFDAITLYATGQQAILGAVILPHWTQQTPPAQAINEYGIQFVRQDAYPPSQVVDLFNLVRSKVSAAPGVQVFYFPAYEQLASAYENQAYFESQGITVSSTARWATGNACYAPGWALGTLKYVAGTDINAAYRSGSLRPEDILLTDGVPAEVPIVAGILTLSPSTPSSHVAILSGTYGTPFAHAALADTAARAQQLVGRKIVLRAYGTTGNCDLRLIDVEGVLTPQQIAEILALKNPPPLAISPMAHYGAYSAPADGLVPADIQYFGGKAANFGFLRRAIPANSPVAAAFSFDLWNAYLDQTLANGRTLRQEIAVRLAGFTYPPANMAALSDTLKGIRDDLFKKTSATVFSQTLQDAILATLTDPQYGFDMNRNIRFRSSTNVEDSAQFSGAGLYDSYSGCLADDLDGDTAGPSICDPTETGERGVFRAIRRVFASFYNDNAYLGRMRYGVNEAEVGMAVLVHHSTPDEFEMANGVATLTRSGGTSRAITLVTQEGAVSVTNPEDGSIPEQVDVAVYTYGTYLTITNYSNLVPLGATVLTWDTDYRALAALLVSVAQAFEQYTGKTRYVLDFEYKKTSPGGALRIKQVRELPQASTTPSIVPFLVNEPTVYETFQGEYANVFANHRLKSRWTIQTRNMWLTAENLAQSLYADVAMEYTADGLIRSLTGPPALWPQGWYSRAGTQTTDGWTVADIANPRTCRLYTSNVGVLVAPSQSPVLTIRDLGVPYLDARFLDMPVNYARPERSCSGTTPTTTTSDQVRLGPAPREQSGDRLQTRTIAGAGGVQIVTSFYWPPPPAGVGAGYTAPLVRWVETTITGYTSQPIVLHGTYSQTYRPEHHNFSEHFIFEPRLEPGLPPAQLDQLRNRNIRLIHAYYGTPSMITTYGVEPLSDLDYDGDVDLADFTLFQACFNGPNRSPGKGCTVDADFDNDGDVDLADFSALTYCYNGPNRAPVCR